MKLKSIEQLMDEADRNGYIEPTCPNCGYETNPTEPDSETALCSECGEVEPQDTLRAYGLI